MEKEEIEERYCKDNAACLSDSVSVSLIAREISGEASRVLLFGPIGTGKTLHGKVLASHSGRCMHVQCSDFMSKGINCVELLQHMFDLAHEKHLGAIFFDDIQLLYESSTGNMTSEEFINLFVKQTEDLGKRSPKTIIIAASYLPWNLSDALLEVFSTVVFIGLPPPERRLSIFGEALQDQDHNFSNYETLVELSDGFSCHEIMSAVNDAAWKSIRKLINDNNLPSENELVEKFPLSLSDIEESVRNTSLCVSANDIQLFEQFMTKYRTEPLYSTHKLVTM